jgi:hypothetical protein
MLCGKVWWLVIDISGQFVCLTFKGQAVQADFYPQRQDRSGKKKKTSFDLNYSFFFEMTLHHWVFCL